MPESGPTLLDALTRKQISEETVLHLLNVNAAREYVWVPTPWMTEESAHGHGWKPVQAEHCPALAIPGRLHIRVLGRTLYWRNRRGSRGRRARRLDPRKATRFAVELELLLQPTENRGVLSAIATAMGVRSDQVGAYRRQAFAPKPETIDAIVKAGGFDEDARRRLHFAAALDRGYKLDGFVWRGGRDD